MKSKHRRPYAPAVFGLLGACCAILLSTAASLHGQGRLLRGPYLQLNSPDSMLIRWRTDAASDSQVRYGTNAAALDLIANTTGATTNHAVVLPALEPDARYFYSVGSTTTVLTNGPDYSFRTPPPAGSRRAMRLWVLGDFGYTNQSAALVRNGFQTFNAGREVDLWLLLGDNAYHGGSDAVWGVALFNTYPSVLRQTPLFSTIGNQETGGSANPPSTIPYFEILNCPTSGELGGEPSGTEKYYSFNYGNVHFICLDSMSSARTNNSPMLQWLEEDLKQVVSDWTIAFWHHPPYSKGSNDSDVRQEQIEMRTNAVRILESYGVDLVLSGHSHSYERSYLLDGHYGLSSTFSPTFIRDNGNGQIGGGGAYEKSALGPQARQGAVYAVSGSGASLGGGVLNHPVMYRSWNRLGSMVLDIQANRLDARFVRETGTVEDSFTMIKAASPLRIAEIVSTNGTVEVEWNAVANRTYYVEQAGQVPAETWTEVSGPIRTGEIRARWSGPLPAGGTNGVLRIRSSED